MTKQTRNTSGANDGAWFLETVGAAPPAPTGSDALADLTAENDAMESDTDSDATPDVAPEPETHESVEDESPADGVDGPDRALATEVTESSDDGADPDEAADDSREPSPEPDPQDIETSADEPEETEEQDTSENSDDNIATTVSPPSPPVAAVSAASVKTTQITLSSFDGDPGTANVTYAKARELRPAAEPAPLPTAPLRAPVAPTVAQPSAPAPSPTVAPVAEATVIDDQLAGPVRSSRSFRWPVAIFVLVVLGAVAVAAFWLPRATRSEALAVRQLYYDVTADVRNQLPDAQQALDVITNPESGASALSDMIPTIAQFGSSAFDMEEAAVEPLPSVLPFLPTTEIDELVPLQDQTAQLGQVGSDLAKELGAGYVYRVSVPDLLNPGNLPVSADTQAINTISITLNASLTADAAIIAELPDDEVFATTWSVAMSTHERYRLWQREYLAALTGEDPETARTLLDELDTMRSELLDSNATDLAAFRSSADVGIVAYAAELEALMTALTATD